MSGWMSISRSTTVGASARVIEWMCSRGGASARIWTAGDVVVPVAGVALGRVRQLQLDDAAPCPRRDVDHRRTGDRQAVGQVAQRTCRESLGDLARLVEPVEHSRDHFVVGAGADAVVGRVADHLSPGQVQLGGGPSVGEQGTHRLGDAFEPPLGPGGRLLDVDPIGRHTHQQIGASATPQLAAPPGEAVDRGAVEIGGQGPDPNRQLGFLRIDLGHDPAEPRARHLMVGPVHPEQPAAQPLVVLVDELLHPGGHERRVVGQVGAVAVALGQVLGADGGPVGGFPPERGALRHCGRHAPPHHRVLQPELGQDLRHLCDVAEHVGQVADGHGAAERGAPLQAERQVADQRLTRDQELVGKDVPRTHGQPSGRGEPAQAGLGLGSELEVVVHDRHLPVEQEMGVRRIPLDVIEQPVEEIDQAEPKPLERQVPLAIPVRVRNDGHLGGHAGSVGQPGPEAAMRTAAPSAHYAVGDVRIS